jgi:two-component system, sensor histidine kinase and response regulator
MSGKIKILYVDDEEQNLVSFRANFRKEYEVFTAISADEALVTLNDHLIPIIISDQRMPKTTGVEFLEKTVKLYPDCIRLLITAQADIELVIEAINRGQISKYIQKPWDWDKLSIAIDNCATLYTSRQELKLKNAELQKANDELNKFVYSVSHDLRAPLTSILGVINLTKISPELKVAEDYFKMIEGRVLKLDDFIKKIIDYYKNARIEKVNEEIDFYSFVNNIWDTFKNQNPSIVFNLKVAENVKYVGDAFRLKIIFENLISNAIKYQNPSSEIKKIDVIINSDSNNLCISVSDNGIGIDAKFLEHVFDLFFRTEDALNAEGTGIGLYLVKETLNKIGGKVTVESQVMQGASFQIVIPNNK